MPSINCSNFEISWSTNRVKSDLTLVLVAGAGGRHLDWPKELRHNRLVNTLSLDLPGHFKLTGEPCTTIEQMADVIGCVVEDQKLQRVVVAGHSMGGCIAQEIGARQPAWSGKGYGLITGAVRKAIMENRPETLYADFSACNNFDIRDRLSDISAPTLVIGGKRDKFTPLKQSEFMVKHIPNATLHVLNAAGHYMAQEQPLPLTRVITSFLKKRKSEN